MGLAIERAENKTEAMRARAGAIDELLESGALTDLTGGRDATSTASSRRSPPRATWTAELEKHEIEPGAGAPDQGQIESGGGDGEQQS